MVLILLVDVGGVVPPRPRYRKGLKHQQRGKFAGMLEALLHAYLRGGDCG
jgi:hypothetical protein